MDRHTRLLVAGGYAGAGPAASAQVSIADTDISVVSVGMTPVHIRAQGDRDLFVKKR